MRFVVVSAFYWQVGPGIAEAPALGQIIKTNLDILTYARNSSPRRFNLFHCWKKILRGHEIRTLEQFCNHPVSLSLNSILGARSCLNCTSDKGQYI